MRNKNSAFDRAVDFACDELNRAGDPLKLPVPVRTLALLSGAQGVIDNGGLQFFFENDWEAQPPYGVFVEAYREIGAEAEANALAAAVALFPFANPHKKCERRREFLEPFVDGGRHLPESPFEPFTDLLCGNERVWTLLKEYASVHAAAFPR
jgi:hypothetical protein